MSRYRISRARASAFLVWVFVTTLLPTVASMAAWTASSPSSQPAQNRPPIPAGPPPNTSYIAGMPSVDTVEREIQGSDPTDTLARQVAVFNILPELIDRMGMDPSRRYGDTTPVESRQRGIYLQAVNELTQGYAKSHTADELKAFNQLHGRYELDGPLRQEMFQKLFTKQFLDNYAKVDAAANAHQQAHYDQEKRAADQAQQAQQRPLSDRDQFFAYLKDPHTVAFLEIIAIPYFLPTIYAMIRGYWRGLPFIFLFNLFFAWTVVGWFGSFVLVYAVGKGVQVQKANQAPPASPPVAPPVPAALPYCPRCGAVWTQGAQLCSHCGAAAG